MTDRQRAFLASYFGASKGNATRAAGAAGYRWPGKQGPRLLTFPEIAAAVDREIQRFMDEQQDARSRRRAGASACREM